MAHTGIFATSDECKYKAGAKASATATAEAYINAFCSMAESFINTATLYNWSDAYSTLNADVKAILSDAASNLVAINIINYDYSSFPSTQWALMMINVLWARTEECLKLLKLEANRTFVQEA
jgi:hypothetical protein